MKTTLLILLALIWVSGLCLLVVALTDLYPSNPLKEHAFVIGIGFIALNGIIRKACAVLRKTRSANW